MWARWPLRIHEPSENPFRLLFRFPFSLHLSESSAAECGKTYFGGTYTQSRSNSNRSCTRRRSAALQTRSDIKNIFAALFARNVSLRSLGTLPATARMLCLLCIRSIFMETEKRRQSGSFSPCLSRDSVYPLGSRSTSRGVEIEQPAPAPFMRTEQRI